MQTAEIPRASRNGLVHVHSTIDALMSLDDWARKHHSLTAAT